ncbi:MAG: hypothetical protein QMC09_19705 [Thauera sp.]
MTSRNTRRKSAFPTALASAVLASLLAACATPGGGSGAEPDAIHRHALVRTAPPAPSWSALHEQLGKAAAGIAGVELGKVDTAGFHVQIPVADGFASGSAQIRPGGGVRDLAPDGPAPDGPQQRRGAKARTGACAVADHIQFKAIMQHFI